MPSLDRSTRPSTSGDLCNASVPRPLTDRHNGLACPTRGLSPLNCPARPLSSLARQGGGNSKKSHKLAYYRYVSQYLASNQSLSNLVLSTETRASGVRSSVTCSHDAHRFFEMIQTDINSRSCTQCNDKRRSVSRSESQSQDQDQDQDQRNNKSQSQGRLSSLSLVCFSFSGW